MAINDLYELTHSQILTPTGEKMMSKWYFVSVAISGTAEDLYDLWVEDNGMEELITNLQCNIIDTSIIRVINLFSLTDFYEGVGTRDGAVVSTEMLPLHNAVNISMKLDTRGVRPGSKRISGLPEAVQAAGLINDATFITNLNALLTTIPLDLEGTADVVFDPVVVKRILDPDPTPSGDTPIYRLPANSGEANYGHINVAVANLRVSHQVSRGNGR